METQKTKTSRHNQNEREREREKKEALSPHPSHSHRRENELECYWSPIIRPHQLMPMAFVMRLINKVKLIWLWIKCIMAISPFSCVFYSYSWILCFILWTIYHGTGNTGKKFSVTFATSRGKIDLLFHCLKENTALAIFLPDSQSILKCFLKLSSNTKRFHLAEAIAIRKIITIKGDIFWYLTGLRSSSSAKWWK